MDEAFFVDRVNTIQPNNPVNTLLAHIFLNALDSKSFLCYVVAMRETELDVLLEIRDLLLLIAEPQLAERDKKWRDELRRIAGKSDKNIKAVMLMDGTRNQSAIAKDVPVDVGQLSKLVKALKAGNLLKTSENPEVVIPVSESIFKEEK
jgi:hypothetical protein